MAPPSCNVGFGCSCVSLGAVQVSRRPCAGRHVCWVLFLLPLKAQPLKGWACVCSAQTEGTHCRPGLVLCSRIIQQLVNGIITPATIPNLGLGPW